jgi:hypothetical protein
MLCEAARGGNEGLVEVLLENGVEINVFVAAAIGDDRALSELLDDAACLGNAVESQNGHDNVATYHASLRFIAAQRRRWGKETRRKAH